MNKKNVWQCDMEGYLIGSTILSKQAGDLGKSGWLIPADCVETEPPKEKEGFTLKWLGEKWEYEKIIPEESLGMMTMPEIDFQEHLNREFVREKDELLKAYLTAELYEDDDLKQEIRSELQVLEVKYSKDAELLDQGKLLKEV